MTKQMKQLQHPSSISEWTPSMRIIPPLHEDFSVYGDAGARKRAREWAYANRYAVVSGLPKCAHAFYMMHCPARCALRVFDHVDLWIDCGGKYAKPFLLAHPYMDTPHQDKDLLEYARIHGLTVSRGSAHDHWYNAKTPPVRVSPRSETVPFPIELSLPTVLTLSPIRWRCEQMIVDDEPIAECQRDHEHQGACSREEDYRKLESFDPDFVARRHGNSSQDDLSDGIS